MSKEPPFSPPAFPVPELKGHHYKGLTKREYYASAAMQALISNTSISDYTTTATYIANEAYAFADAMIERGQK